ncbi:MAG: site-specific integrase [Conexibacter sp.]|nr:site-specific integrase [Conexibacter sp.]
MAMSNGIESRTTEKGARRYRGAVKVGGKLKRGPWGSHAEARSWRSKALGEIEAGTMVKSSAVTVRAAWEDFYAQAVAGTAMSRSRKPFKAATLRGYVRGWAKIDPELGAHRLTDLRRGDVQAMVDRWAASGMSPSTIRNSLDPLRVIYRRAIDRELVSVNPTDRLDVPADRDDEPMRFASRDEAARLIAAVPEGERALWATAMYAGLRRGELRALRWTDVDLGAGLIDVQRSWDDSEGEQAPKTKGSQRRVPIVPALADALRAQQTTTKRTGSDLVFGRTASEPFIPTTARARALAAWKKANSEGAKRLGRPLRDDETLHPITLHQCRHTMASLMIAAGCNAKALSVVMGHASISITFDRYGKLMPGGESEVGRLLGEYLEAA